MIRSNCSQTSLFLPLFTGIRLYQDDSSQWRDSAKLRNEQIRSMIAAWMFVNNNPRWSYGLKFVQLTLNSNINNELKRSPYEALFKMLPVLRPATVTLSSSTTDTSLQQQTTTTTITTATAPTSSPYTITSAYSSGRTAIIAFAFG